MRNFFSGVRDFKHKTNREMLYFTIVVVLVFSCVTTVKSEGNVLQIRPKSNSQIILLVDLHKLFIFLLSNFLSLTDSVNIELNLNLVFEQNLNIFKGTLRNSVKVHLNWG